MSVFAGKQREYNTFILEALALTRQLTAWEIAKYIIDKRPPRVELESEIAYVRSQRIYSVLIRKNGRLDDLKGKNCVVQHDSKWQLTLNGLILTLRIKRVWEKIDLVARNHVDKLLMFEEWESFSPEDKQEIMKHFDLAFGLPGPLNLEYIALYSPQNVLRDYVEGPFVGGDAKWHKGLYEITKRNPRLRKEHLMNLRRKLTWHEEYVESLKEEIKKLEGFD